MVAISTAPQVWRPKWIDEAEAPTFTWRVPTVTERELFEGGMVAYNALAVYPWDIAAQFRAGLEALLPDNPDEAARLDELRERQVNGETLAPPDVAAIEEATAALMQYWPGYRLMVAQAARREAVLPVVAFRTFVTAWDDRVGAELRRGLDGLITEASIEAIDPLIIRSLGTTIYNSLYARGAEKNSAAPSPSEGDPATSTTTTPRAGKSGRTSGKKTPAA